MSSLIALIVSLHPIQPNKLAAGDLVPAEYVKPECLDEAISVFFAGNRQTLIGE